MKRYNFNINNKILYKKWIKNKCFKSRPNFLKKPYYLLLPPPNITGDLHIGHVLNFTILDVFSRFKRMKGYNVCWIPGTDHASIATEIKIRKILREKNIKNISDNKFKKICFNWSKKYNKIIITQLKNIGCSCDWSKFNFTMGKNHYKSVKKVFIDLYNKGLIYKKKRIINWDVNAKTTISDEEVQYKKKITNLYYIKYYTEDRKKYLIIATTRPETIFGDTAICINPSDRRYKKFINKKVIVPIINRIVPVITDKLVNPKKGTGCLKITPAHSNKDYTIYNKHKKIKIINILNDDGTLNNNCSNYKNLDRFLARKLIEKELKKCGYLIKKKNKISNIGYSERTNTVIEKKLSLQWYLKIKSFKKKTLKLIKLIKILPHKKYITSFYKWLKRLKDWNISRQLIWGHRIPIYYYNNKIIAANSLNSARKIIKKKFPLINILKIKKDRSVLDTWFSSWILPISVLGGCEKKKKSFLKYYYPINILITGYDILFFWVLRMIMFGAYYNNKPPFNYIYFTGIARDKNNNKLSKSLGNYKNLKFYLNKYGADVLRVALLSNNFSHDFIFNDKDLISARNFINKLWNSFILINNVIDKKEKKAKKTRIFIKPFSNIFYYNLRKVNFLLKNKKIYESVIFIKKIFKKEFCSKFLEYIKKCNLNQVNKKQILNIYKLYLKILHPYIPFITEYISDKLNLNKVLTVSKWPKIKKIDPKKVKKIKITFNFINFLNRITLKKNKETIVIYINQKNKYFLNYLYLNLLYKITLIKKIKVFKGAFKKKYKTFYFKKFKLYISINNLLTKEDTINYNKTLKKKILFYKNYLFNIKKKLRNHNFLLYAPKNIVKLEEKKYKDIKKKLHFLKKKYLFNKIY